MLTKSTTRFPSLALLWTEDSPLRYTARLGHFACAVRYDEADEYNDAGWSAFVEDMSTRRVYIYTVENATVGKKTCEQQVLDLIEKERNR